MKISKKAWNSYRDKLSAINQKAATAMQKYIEANGLDDLDKIIHIGIQIWGSGERTCM